MFWVSFLGLISNRMIPPPALFWPCIFDRLLSWRQTNLQFLWLLHNLVCSATCRGCRWHLWRCINAIIWALSICLLFSFHTHLHSSGAQRYQPNNSILNNGKYFTATLLPDIATTIALSAQQHSVNAISQKLFTLDNSCIVQWLQYNV